MTGKRGHKKMDIFATEMVARTLRDEHERMVKQEILSAEFRRARRDRKRSQGEGQSMLASVINKFLHPIRVHTAKA
jgi:glutamyl-tRNA reductase